MHELDDVRQGAVAAALVFPEKPDDGCHEVDGGLDKEVALLLDPLPVEAQHDGAGGLGGVGDVMHGARVEGIAAVGPGEVIEVDDVEPWLDGVLVLVAEQGVVGDAGQVVVLEVVEKEGEAFANVLGDDVADDEVGLAGTGGADHEQRPEGVDDVDPAAAPFAPELVPGRQVDGVLVLQQALLLRKGLVEAVEDVPVQLQLDQPGKQSAAGQQKQVAQQRGAHVERGGCGGLCRAQKEYMAYPIEQQSQQQVYPDGATFDVLVLFALGAQQRDRQQEQGRCLRCQQALEKRQLPDVEHHAVHYGCRQFPLREGGMAGDVEMQKQDNQAQQPGEVDDLAQGLCVFSGVHFL